jgi:hypothetical protein
MSAVPTAAMMHQRIIHQHVIQQRKIDLRRNGRRRRNTPYLPRSPTKQNAWEKSAIVCVGFVRQGSSMRHAAKSAGPISLDAIKVPAAAFGPGAALTYTVIEKPADKGEKRGETRRRTRLRSGKILDARNKFLVECQVYDRSARGARLRLVANIFMPPRLRLFDDETKLVCDARVIWRRNHELGVSFATRSNADDLRPSERAALAGKFYAVRS